MMGYQVKHGRIKERYSPVPNAAEARHEARLRELPCVNCGGVTEELHHLMQDCPGKRFRRDHRFQIPLCTGCHRGPYGIHGVGNEALWSEAWKLDLPAIAVRLWEESRG